MSLQVARVLAVAGAMVIIFHPLVWKLCLGASDQGEHFLTILQHCNICHQYLIGFSQMGGVGHLVYLLNKAEKALTKML